MEGAELLETRGWDDRASGVIVALVFLIVVLSDGGDLARIVSASGCSRGPTARLAITAMFTEHVSKQLVIERLLDRSRAGDVGQICQRYRRSSGNFCRSESGARAHRPSA
jgi:hypothetical protein